MNNKFVIYDTVYKEIHIKDPLFQKLIFVPEFQRLKNIYQLGLLTFVRSSAKHTRYSHSLGIFWLLEFLFNNSSFNFMTLEERREVQVAGLFHDLGHGPFSHNFEKVLPGFVHEDYSVNLIRNPQGTILPLLKKAKLNIDRICNLITNKTTNDWAQTLISGQFDLDRLDYMIRDQHFTGSGIQLFDYKTLLSNVFYLNGQIVFAEPMIKHVESYLLFRFHIYFELFWNLKNLLLENALGMLFQRLRDLQTQKVVLQLSYEEFGFILQNKNPTLSQFLRLTDSDIFALLKKIYFFEKDPVLRALASLFVCPNKHYDDYISTKPQALNHWAPELRFYFQFNVSRKLVIYDIEDSEILFSCAQNKICKLSEASIIFNETKKYRSTKLIFLNITI